MITEPKEGYFKFLPRFVNTVGFKPSVISELNRWRERLFALELIGMYKSGELSGIGYGNISVRTSDGFIITATRTGGLEHLGPQHYTEIVGVDLARNSVDFKSHSPAVTPSAECMTHAAFYQADPAIGAVIHVHHLEFWKRLLDKVPTTASHVAYGTPEMALEILRLYGGTNLSVRKLAAMAGHEEGIISFGRDLDEAGAVLLEAWKG
jgi:ribulose-5-phosphate 4-epimerase/fuculose-1-phosphate aldolase